MRQFFNLGQYKAEQTIHVDEYESVIRGKVKPFLNESVGPQYVISVDISEELKIDYSVEVHGTLYGDDASVYLEAAMEANKYARMIANQASELASNNILATVLFKQALESKDYEKFSHLSMLIPDVNKSVESKSNESILDAIVRFKEFKEIRELYEEFVLNSAPSKSELSSELKLIDFAMKSLFKKSLLTTSGEKMSFQRLAAIDMILSGYNTQDILKDRKLYLKIAERTEQIALEVRA